MGARRHLTLGVVDHASKVIEAAQAMLDGTSLPGPPMFADAEALVLRYRGRGGERVGMVVTEVLPSPAFLRWLADHIEADLRYREQIG